MLPTPETSHVEFNRVYEPAEDSYLLLDTLSSAAETDFLSRRFNSTLLSKTRCPSPIVVEVGTGSGVVLAFINAHASLIFARNDILTLGMDMNIHACHATAKTVQIAAEKQIEESKDHASYIGNLTSNLNSGLRDGLVDVLVFNPPYVPTDDLPSVPEDQKYGSAVVKPTYEEDSAFLALSYAGGRDGMEITDRLLDAVPTMLSERGVAYVLLCAQNKPEAVKSRIRTWGEEWEVETVGSSGKQAGWEKLCVVRMARRGP